MNSPVHRLKPETLRYCDLLALKAQRPLTELEQADYEEACARIDQRIAQSFAAALAHDTATEAHAFPQDRINFHD